jgi:putative ABC transport system permease protein
MAFKHEFVLAWRMLSDRPGRFLLSIIGVAFAVVVMFTELGFLNGITDSSVNFATILGGDLIVVHPRQRHLKSYVEFPAAYLREVEAVPGVVSARAMYTGAAYWSNPVDGSRSRVFMIGVDLADPMLRVPEIAAYREDLKGKGTVLFDRSVRPELGRVVIGTRTLLAKHPIRVVGIFSLGPNFAYEGNLIMSAENFLDLSPRSNNRVGLGMVRVAKGESLEAVRSRIRERLPGLVDVLTPAEITAREKKYTTDNAPIGIVFGLGLIVGFAIGTVVCYQILFNEVSDHLPQFAMIKAIGHFPRYLTALVMHEALILSLGGYAAGLAVALGLYALLQDSTALQMNLNLHRASLILFLTTGMCLLASWLALKKVHATDPADLF